VLNHITTQKIQGGRNTIIFATFQKNVSLTKNFLCYSSILGTPVSKLTFHNIAKLPLA